MKTYELKSGQKLEIIQDSYSESPREWDNLARMVFFGSHSHLGDKHFIDSDVYDNWEDLEKHITKIYDAACVQRIYAYSHSGMTISTEPFSCPWDSGTLGFAVITKKALRENYNIKKVTNEYIQKGYEHIKGEIEVLDQYITGDVYGFNLLDRDNETIDSCWGFYGSDIEKNGILEHLSLEIAEEIKNLI